MMILQTQSEPVIDLNADLGEGFPWDAALLDRVSSASLSCGAHAGDPDSIRQTLRMAKARGVVVGAHPGYADRKFFGRREQFLPPQEIETLIRSQVADLAKLAVAEGVSIRFLKPHGALYNQAQREEAVAKAVLAAALGLGLPLIGQPGTILADRAQRAGVTYLPEGFADRRYRPDGRLVPRTEPNAFLTDLLEIEAQILRLVKEGVVTLCLHGDDTNAVAFADRIRSIFEAKAIQVGNLLADAK